MKNTEIIPLDIQLFAEGNGAEGEASSDETEPENATDNKELDDLKATVDKLKKALSNANTESAEYRRKLKSKQTEDEQRAEAEAEKDKKFADLERRLAISENKSAFANIGFTAENAQEAAEAFADKDFERLSNCISTFKAELEKQIKAEIAKSAPKLGGNSATKTAEEKNIEYAKARGEARAKSNQLSADKLAKFINK